MRALWGDCFVLLEDHGDGRYGLRLCNGMYVQLSRHCEGGYHASTLGNVSGPREARGDHLQDALDSLRVRLRQAAAEIERALGPVDS